MPMRSARPARPTRPAGSRSRGFRHDQRPLEEPQIVQRELVGSEDLGDRGDDLGRHQAEHGRLHQTLAEIGRGRGLCRASHHPAVACSVAHATW